MEGTGFIFWNWTVVVYLFVAGVSAGTFAISAFAYLLDRKAYENIARIGAYIAPFPLIFGIACLIYDLERPYLFWKLMITVKTRSIMSLGSWLLLIFSVISFGYFYLWLPDRFDIVEMVRRKLKGWDKRPIGRWLKTSRLLERLQRRNLDRFKAWAALAGIPIALMVGIYTGVLLSVLVARPFWNNPMLPMLFLLSALKTGTAAICLVSCFGLGSRAQLPVKRIGTSSLIHSIDSVLMLLSLIAISLFIFGLYTSSPSSAEAARLIMGGAYTFLFWGFAIVVGVLLPLVYKVYELMPYLTGTVSPGAHRAWPLGLVTLAVLVGAFMLRYVLVYAGQAASIISL